MSTTKERAKIFNIEKCPLLRKKREFSLHFDFFSKNKSKKLITNQASKVISPDSKNATKEDILLKPTRIIKKGKWSEEEDKSLIKYVNRFGVGNWNKIEKYFVGRTRKQLRQRYINEIQIKKISEYSNDNIDNNINEMSDRDESKEKINPNKIQFTWDEMLDKVLLKEYFLSKKSWVKISKKIPGTSENSVKNRFYSLLRKKVNKTKKEYKYKNIIEPKKDTIENNDNLILLIKKELIGNQRHILYNNTSLDDTKELLFNNDYFEFDYFDNKSKKKNYSVEILLEFLPELLEEKGININEILDELKKRKNIAAKNIFVIIEKHYESYKNYNDVNNDLSSISTDIEFNSLQNEQSEKLGIVIKNMKIKIMCKYFYRFRYNTLGI
jgi:hypothetical protein